MAAGSQKTTHVKDATGDREQIPCDLHTTVAAEAAALDSFVWSKGWAELACKLGVDSAQPSIVVETGAARTLLSIENVPTICNDD